MHTMRWMGALTVALALAAALGAGCGDDTSATTAGPSSSGSGAQGGQGATGGDVTTAGMGGMGGAGGIGGGSGGDGGAGGAGGQVVVEAECLEATDCQLVDNCCDCMGFPGDETPPACPQQCIQDKCAERQVPLAGAACEVGRCVLDVSCDPAAVVCLAPQPACPAGETAAVVGQCWGGCVPITECADVGDCAACAAAGAVCVVEITQLGLVHHCVETPPSCASSPDCSCMGDSVCLAPFDTCSDVTPGQIDCSCPTC